MAHRELPASRLTSLVTEILSFEIELHEPELRCSPASLISLLFSPRKFSSLRMIDKWPRVAWKSVPITRLTSTILQACIFLGLGAHSLSPSLVLRSAPSLIAGKQWQSLSLPSGPFKSSHYQIARSPPDRPKTGHQSIISRSQGASRTWPPASLTRQSKSLFRGPPTLGA